ncbi:hypothetical protein HHK36_027799 [Tetracentron sinense]|uniref:Cytochrome P450 n=1 Tax=Tetracentron sinense TaxID=13715 RepID=A0A835D1D7_TETSI|nr:hypothetical protein HHK36_027799 [Tetracentron sinense]
MFRDWSNTISTACEHKMEVLMLVIFFLSSVLYLALRRSEKQINLPPGPYPWPILGNLLQLGRKLHIDLASMAETNGPIFSLRLGTQPVVVASSPAVAAEILKTHDYLLSARYVTHTFRVPKYINSSLGFAFHCDERWRSLRAICKTQLFSTKMLEAQSQLRQKKVSELVGLISRKGGDAVTIGEMVFSIVFNILSNSTFSMDIISMDESSGASDLKKHISRIMEVAVAPNLEDFYPVLSGLDIQGLNREAATYIERIYGMWETLIQERREKGKDDDSNDFLKALLSSGLSDLQIKALLLVYLYTLYSFSNFLLISRG